MGIFFVNTFATQNLSMQYNFNGKIINGEGLNISIQNRALNYGDGIFESVKYANDQLNFWEDHYFRLMASMRIVRMEIPLTFSPEFLEVEIRKTLEANQLEGTSARVRLTVYRKDGGLYAPQTNEIDYLIRVSEHEHSSYELNENGLNVDLFKDHYKMKGLLSNIKSTSAQFYAIASIYRTENDLDECILLNQDKSVCEAISANVFIVQGELVSTPPLSDGCLKGVMRKNVMKIVEELGYRLEERSFSPFEIQKADELFLTNASRGIQWVGAYRKKTFKNECAKKVTKTLNKYAVTYDTEIGANKG